MPFTFSHPAAAVPFTRLGLPLSALVVGSMSPDFLYFLTLETAPKFGHTIPGIFLFCVPVGLGVLWVFHRLLKRPFVDLLPPSWQPLVAPAVVEFSFGPPRQFVMICIAIALGAATHIIWDGFTSMHGWAVELAPWLRTRFELGLPETVAGFRIVQHLSTLVGAGLLAFWSARWLRRRPPGSAIAVFGTRARLAIWVLLPAFVVVAGILNARRFGWFGDPYWMIQQAMVHGVVGAITGLFVFSLVLAVVWKVAAARRRPQEATASRDL